MANRRSVLYLILGAVLGVAGILVMLWGRLDGSGATQLAGIIMYLASMPLLFQAKLTAIAGRIARLERKATHRYAGAFSAARYAGEDEE